MDNYVYSTEGVIRLKRLVSVLLVLALLLPGVAMAVTSATISVREPTDPEASIKKVSSRRASFQCTYKNYNTSKTVKSFDIAYYSADINEEQNSAINYETIQVRLKPYSTEWTGEIFFENVNDLYYLYLGVYRVRFTDGTTESLDMDDIDYFCWDNSGAWWLK